jgi:hypothetical protein
MTQYVCRETFCSEVCGQNEGKLLRSENELNVTENKGNTLSPFYYNFLFVVIKSFIINRIL